MDLNAWDNAARVDLWNKIDPADLFEIGLNIVRVAACNLSRVEAAGLLTQATRRLATFDGR